MMKIRRWKNTIALKRVISEVKEKHQRTGKDYHIILFNKEMQITDNSFIVKQKTGDKTLNQFEVIRFSLWSNIAGVNRNMGEHINIRKIQKIKLK